MASLLHISRDSLSRRYPGATRVLALSWIGFVALAAAVQLIVEPPVWSQEIALLAALGFFGCARPIRLGTKLEICVAQPVAFAALLRSGTSAALVVVVACILGASLIGRPSLGALKVGFNVATGMATMLAASAALLLTAGTVTSDIQQEIFLPLLVATLAAFLVSTLPVAAAAALETGKKAASLWAGKFLPTAPAYLAGTGLAILLSVALASYGPLSFLFLVPLALLFYNQSLLSVTAR